MMTASAGSKASSAGPTARSMVGSSAAPSSGSPDADMPGRSTAGDCRGIRNHAPLARRCRGIREPGPTRLACADRSSPGSSVVDGWRRAGRKVHSGAGAPSAVTDRLWTVRGRELDCGRSPVLGDPRCCCVLPRAHVSVSCTDPGPLAGGAPVPIRRGCRCRRWPGARRCCTSASPDGQHQHAATGARSITNPDRQAQTLATVAEALAAKGETKQARHVASVACAFGRRIMALVPVLSLEPSAVRVLTDP